MEAVESMRGDLRSAVARPGAGGTEALLDLLGELARRDRLTALIEAVLKDPGEAARNAPASFRHTLGFEKLVLVSGEPDFMLRLHLWHPVDRSRSPGHIHNHRAAVLSTVLCGLLEKHTFARDISDDPEYRVAEYHEERTDEEWRLRPVTPSGLRRTGQGRFGPGTSYALPADVLHRIGAAEDRLTMTLFLETTQIRASTEVFAALEDEVPESIAKLPLTVADYRRRLESALAQVAALPQ